VKGFIKGPASATPNQQKGKKKKKKKDQDDGAIYESVAKIDKHRLFENEIDALLDENERAAINEVQEVSAEEDGGQSEDEEEAQVKSLV
jgi:uncharacterized protein YpiB (UPF0302 family)